MGRVAGVFDNPPGFPCTPPGVDILEGGKLTSNNVAGSSHDPLQSPAVASGAVSKQHRCLKVRNLFFTKKDNFFVDISRTTLTSALHPVQFFYIDPF